MYRLVTGGTRRWRLDLWLGPSLAVVALLHAGLEGFDALREVSHDTGQLAGSEEDDDDHQHNEPVQQAEFSHEKILGKLRCGLGWSPAPQVAKR